MKNIKSMCKTGLVSAIGLCLLGSMSVSAAANKCSMPKNVRVVIGSTSTGGDTYQNAAIVSDLLAKQMGVHMKVDAVGAVPAFRALKKSRNGNTIMIFHDFSYLGNLYGVEGFPDLFDEFKVGPTVSINAGNAYLVPKKSKYKTLQDVIDAAKDGEEVKFAVQPGAVSALGFDALRNAVKNEAPGKEKNLVAVNTGSQADKNQMLFGGYADVINGTIAANLQYTYLPEDDQKAMRFVWLTAKHDTLAKLADEKIEKSTGKDFYKYADPDVSVKLASGDDFTFDKEFFLIYNKNMDDKMVSCIDDQLKKVYDDGKVEKKLKKAFFVPDFVPTKESQKNLRAKRDTYKKMLSNIQ